MIVEFLGVGSCRPEFEQADTASLLVNRKIMIDTGWFALRNLMRTDALPQDLRALFFTHMHQDHYLALPQLLFYLMNEGIGFEQLTIYGPEGVEEIVAQALTFGGYEKYYSRFTRPKVRVLQSGETVTIDDVEVRCIASHHAVESRSYRVTDRATGGSFAFSGDTAPYAEFAEFARGCDVVIHEASFATRETPEDNPYCHSSCMDAARAAASVGAKTLYMVHASEASREETVAAAKKIFPDSRRPFTGDTFTL